jgi:pyruvate/2-oxoglutarate dehydrogenase complex dihydrolipoamide dehydrogenase (E3) component
VLELDDGSDLRGDKLLVATGQRPRVEGIGRETVGIEANPRRVAVDSRMQATEGVWAIGEVTGIFRLTHLAGEVVARSTARADERVVQRAALLAAARQARHAGHVCGCSGEELLQNGCRG